MSPLQLTSAPSAAMTRNARQCRAGVCVWRMAALFQQLFSECPLVDEATTDSDAPTPGFVFNDIIQLTQKSGEDCAKVLSHILTRLALRRPHIKLKALALIRHLLSRGPPQFRRELQRKAEHIRACLAFRGPPDPLHGDALYAAVRDAAQSVLNSLYDTVEPSHISPASGSSGMGGSMAGFGVTALSSDASSASSYSAKAMSSTPMSVSSNQGQYTYVQSSRAIGRFIPNPEADEDPSSVTETAAAVVDFIKAKVSGSSVSSAISSLPAAKLDRAATLSGVGADGGRFVNYQHHLLSPDGLQNTAPMGGWVDPAEGREHPQTAPLVDELLSGSPTLSRAEISQLTQKCLKSPGGIEFIVLGLSERVFSMQASTRWQQRLRGLIILDALRSFLNDQSYLASVSFQQRFAESFNQFSTHKSVLDKAQQLWSSLYGPHTLSPLQQQSESAKISSENDSLFAGLSAADTPQPLPDRSFESALFDSLTLSDQSKSPTREGDRASKISSDLLLLNFSDQTSNVPAASFDAGLQNASLSIPHMSPSNAHAIHSLPKREIDSFSFIVDEFKSTSRTTERSQAAPPTNESSSFGFL